MKIINVTVVDKTENIYFFKSKTNKYYSAVFLKEHLNINDKVSIIIKNNIFYKIATASDILRHKNFKPIV